MREKFQHFMQGRYGADQLSRFLTTIGLVLIILNLFVRSNIIVYLVMAILLPHVLPRLQPPLRRESEIPDLAEQNKIQSK